MLLATTFANQAIESPAAKPPQSCHPVEQLAPTQQSKPLSSLALKSSMGFGVESTQINFLGFYKDVDDIVDYIFAFAGPKVALRQSIELPGYTFIDGSGTLCSGGSEGSYSEYQKDALRLRTLKWSLNMRLGADFVCGHIHLRPFGLFHWDRIVSNGIATETPLFKDYPFLRMSYSRLGLGFETSYQTKKSEVLFGLSYSFPKATFKMSNPQSTGGDVGMSNLETEVGSSRLGLDAYISGGFALNDIISIIARADYTTLFARGKDLRAFSFGSYRSTYARMSTASATISVRASY